MLSRRLLSWGFAVFGILVSVAVFAGLQPASAQSEIVLPPVDVAFVQGDCNGSNLVVRRDEDPVVQRFCLDSLEQRSVVEFDLSSLDGLAIESATLSMTKNNGARTSIDLFAFGGDGAVTTDDWGATEVPFGSVDVSNPPTTVDVTAVAQAAGGDPLGFLLVDPDGNDGGAFFDPSAFSLRVTVADTDPMIYLSSTSGGNAGGVSFSDEDILRYDVGTGTWSMVFEGSDVGVGSSDVDAFRIVEDPALGGSELIIEMSFKDPRSISGLGSIDDSDIVVFTGTGGTSTSGTFSRLTDFSDIGISTSGEDVDAWTADGTDYLLSTLGGINASGASGADEDLFRFTPTTLGDPTAGSLAVLFDGSDVLPTSRDLIGASYDEGTGQLYGSFLSGFSANGVTTDGDDVVVFTGNLGSSTTGVFDVIFDGDVNGFVNEQIDGLHVLPGNAAPSGEADLAVAIDDGVPVAAPAGSTVTFSVEVTNGGPVDAEDTTVVLTVPPGVTFLGTSGCDNDGGTPPCELGTIAAGATKSFTFDAELSATPGATVTTEVAVAATNPDPGMGDNSASVDTMVAIAATAVDDGPASNSVPGEPFHIAEGDSLSLSGVAGLLANDDLGDPAAQTITFGGGDLGGGVSDNAAGSSISLGSGGSLEIGADGAVDFTPPSGFTGTFQFDYAISNPGGTSVATVEILVGERPQLAVGDIIYLSSTSGGTVGGVQFSDEDILRLDTATGLWSMFFDGSDVQLGASDIDGFNVVSAEPDNTVIEFTVTAARRHDDIGPFDDSDVILFTGTSGPDTSGTLSLLIDGSDVGLSLNGEDLDALAQDPDGDYAFSTLGNHNVPGVGGGRDEDLTLFDPLLLGPTTAGSFSVLIDGSDIGLGAKDIRAATIHPVTGAIYTMTPNTLRVDGLTSDQDDIIVHTGDTGPDTSGTWSLFFDGDVNGFGGEQIDGVSIEFANADPVANPDRAATDENTPITIGPDYTRSISADGGDISDIAVDPRTGHYVVLDIDSTAGLTTRVRVYDPVNRRVVASTTMAAPRRPAGVDVDPRNGNIVVATNTTNEVTVFDPALTTVLDSQSLGIIPGAVTVDPNNGNIIVGGLHDSTIFSPDLSVLGSVEHDDLFVTGLDVDERNGGIVAVLYEDQGSSAPGQIERWDSDGEFLQTVTASGMDFPWDLSVEQATGDIAVANLTGGGNGEVFMFDENGNLESILGGLGAVRGVAFDPVTGYLAVAHGRGTVIDPATGDLVDAFMDRLHRALAVQPFNEEILAVSLPGAANARRLVTLAPTARALQNLMEDDVIDVATDPTTGRIAMVNGLSAQTRTVEIYDPTGTTMLHSRPALNAKSVAFNPDTGDVAVSLFTSGSISELQVYDPTLGTLLSNFPLPPTDGLGVQPSTGHVVHLSGFNEVGIVDGGAPVGTITVAGFVSDVAVDPATGNIAIALANGDTEIWDPTGTTMIDSIAVRGPADGAVGVAYGGTGNLYLGYNLSSFLDVMVQGVLANDSDPDDDPVSITGSDTTSANGAAVTVNPDGSFSYDPTGVAAIADLDAGETLADTFGYTIGDGNGGTATGTVTVFVAGVNDAPVLGGPPALTVEENTAAVTDYDAADDRDSEGSGLTYSLIGVIDDALFSIDPTTGALAFHLAADFEDPGDEDADNVYQILVRVTDANGSGHAQAVSVTVTDVEETGSITVVQQTEPDWAVDFAFTGDLGAFALDDDAAAPSGSGDNTLSNTFTAPALTPGLYSVAQDLVSGFLLTDLVCTGGSASVDVETRTTTVDLAAGDVVTCTFTTQPLSDVTVSFSDSPDPVQAGQTLTYVLNMSTTGIPVTNPVVTVELPFGVTYQGSPSFGAFCSETAPAVVTCDGFNGLWSGLGIDIEVLVDPGTVGPITATGSVSFTGVFDPDLANNTVTIETTVDPLDE